MIGRSGLEEAIRQAANPVVLMQRVADEAMALVEGAGVHTSGGPLCGYAL
jgi:hypothetical protein